MTRQIWNSNQYAWTLKIGSLNKISFFFTENQNKCYDRDFLLSCTDTPASTKSPPNWDKILQDFPELMRKVSDTNQDDLMDSPPSPMIKLPRKIFDPNTGNWTDEPSRAWTNYYVWWVITTPFVFVRIGVNISHENRNYSSENFKTFPIF